METLDLDELMNRVLQDRELLDALLLKFESASSEQLRVIRGILSAETPTAEDIETAARTAHTLAGSSGNISAHPLRQAAIRLETAIRAGEAGSTEFQAVVAEHETLMRKIRELHS